MWQKYKNDLLNDKGESEWPRQIWLGTSVESQKWAPLRLEPLRMVPAPVRFVSTESLLGPLDLRKWLGDVVK